MNELFLKQASEKYPISMNFRNAINNTEIISELVVTATTENGVSATSIVIDASSIEITSCKAVVKGGINGEKYKITFKITSNEGNTYEDSVYMLVRDSALLADVKTNLRISNVAYDTEISDIISACKLDLQLSGVEKTKILDTDPLIKRAIILYAKSNFGFDNPDSEKLQKSYDLLKQHLSLAGDYNVV